MQTSIGCDTDRDALEAVTSDVFRTMLDLDVVALKSGSPCSSQDITATVQFLGKEQGAVLIHCETKQAIAFASRMMGEAVDAVNDDVRDVLGELANVVGGNLKSIFSPGGSLSLPLVAEGKEFSLHLCEPGISNTIVFESEVGIFSVMLTRVCATQ